MSNDINLRIRVQDSASRELRGISDAANETNTSLNGVGSAAAIAAAGVAAAATATVALASAALTATLNAAEFEKVLTDIKTIAPTTDMAALADQLLNVSAAWGLDKIAAAKAQYDIMSSGITDAGEAFKVFEGAAKLATATGVEVSETAPTITAAMNAWGLSAGQVGDVMDSLAITTQDGVVRMSELGPVFGQVAATAAGAGVSLQELNAGVAALTLGGAPAAQAGTQLKAVISELIKPSEELDKAFRAQTGSSAAAFLKANGLAKSLDALKVITKGNVEVTAKLFGSQEAVAGVLPLVTKQSENFTASLKKQTDAIGKSGKATEEMAEIVKNSADFQLKKLRSTMDALSVDIGAVFLPALVSATKFLNEAAGAARAFLKENKAALDQVGAAAVGMVRDFSGFVKAIAISNDLKATLVSLAKTAVSTSSEFIAGFGKIDSVLSNNNTGLKSLAESLKDAKVVIDAAAFALGTLASIGIDVFVTFKPLRLLFEGFSAAVTSAQRAIFGFTGVFDKLDKKLLDANTAAEKVQKSIKALGREKLELEPKINWVKPLTDDVIQLGKAITGRDAALKRSMKLAGEAWDDYTKKANDAAKNPSIQTLTAGPNAIKKSVSDAAAQYPLLTEAARKTGVEIAKGFKLPEADIADMKDYEQPESRIRLSVETPSPDIFKAYVEAIIGTWVDAMRRSQRELDAVAWDAQATAIDVSEGYVERKKAEWEELVSIAREELKAHKKVWTSVAESAKESFASVGEFLQELAAGETRAWLAVGGAIVDGVKWASSYVIEAWDTTLSTIQTLMGAFTGQLVTSMATQLSGLVTGVANARESMKKITSELLAVKIVGSTEGLAKETRAFTKAFVASARSWINDLGRGADDLVASLTDGVMNIVDLLNTLVGSPEFVEKIGAAAGTLINNFAAMIPKLVEAFMKLLPTIIQGIVKNLPLIIGALLDGVLNLIRTVGPQLVQAASNMIVAIIQRLPEIIDTLLGLVPSIIAEIPKIVLALVEAIPGIITAIVDNLPAITDAIIAAIPKIIEAVIANLPEILSALVEAIPTIFASLMKGAVGILVGSIEGALKGLAKYCTKLGEYIWDGLKNMLSKAGDILKGLGGQIFNGLWDGFKWAWEKLKSFGKQIFNGLWDGIIGIWDDFTKLGRNIFVGFWNALTEVAYSIGDTVASWFGWSEGGVVPGTSRMPGNSKNNDTVPAMLSPGEIVIPRSALNGGLEGAIGFLTDVMGANTSTAVGNAMPVQKQGFDLSQLVAAIGGQDIVVQVDGREVARAVRGEVQRGFRLT